MKIVNTFSSFSVDSSAKAKDFYRNVLGLNVKDEEHGMGLHIDLPDGDVFIYEKPDHAAATFTVLNFTVENVELAVDELMGKGIKFEKIDFGPDGPKTDGKGIMRGKAAKMGPDIAWFKDPAGNTLAVLED